VFIQLARNAGVVAQRDDLVGWLYTTTHHAAANLKRAESRRQAREQEAHTMHDSVYEPAGDASWKQLRPVLDEAMLELGEMDRRALLLRFFEEARFTELGRRLGVSEDAARMRVDRALDKLRVLLARRGITSTSAALAGMFTSQSAVAAPAGLASAVTGAALAGASGGAVTATTGILMSIKSVIAATVVVGTVGLAIYTFTLAGEPAPAAGERGTGAPARSVQVATPDSGAKLVPVPDVTPAVALRAEPTRVQPGTLTLRQTPPSNPVALGLPPPIELSEVLGPNNSYRDDVFGISGTFPQGWSVREARRWGEQKHKNTVELERGRGYRPACTISAMRTGRSRCATSRWRPISAISP
jgi:RNA polymerase sigma factor (sigma-70 family)